MSDAADPPLWNDDQFCQRVAEIAAARNKSVRRICQDAGLAPDYLNKPAARNGRSIEALMRISRELEVSLIELIRPVDRHDAQPTDNQLSRLALVAEIGAYLLIALGARKEMPTGVDASDVVSRILLRIEGDDR